MTHRFAVSLALVAALTTVAACGGKKRPPAVTGTGTTVATPSPTPDPSWGAGSTTTTPPDDFSPIDAGGPTVTDWDPTASEGQGPLADIFFGYDQAALSDEARSLLEKHALWLQNHRDAKVVVEGHCDERGTVEYNLALGEQRARAAHDYLKSLGVAEDRMRIVSFGKEKPIDPGHDEAAWARNRRAHFTLTR